MLRNFERGDTLDEKILQLAEYDFLREDERLGENILYLTLAGSISYGTNNADSDVDIRGVAVESMNSLLLNTAFEQIVDDKTDTVIFGLRKFFKLCAENNPNVLDLLGTKSEHILYMSAAGKKIRDNVNIFLSKLVYKTFSSFATAQLRRLQNALAHDSYPQREKNLHILNSIKSMMMSCREEYGLNNSAINFETTDEEIFISVAAEKLPLRKFLAMNSGIGALLRNYDKLNNRRRRKDDNHLNKHAMHLIRMYLTGIDILDGRGIVTYREKDLPLLKKIRAGEIPFVEVFEMADELKKKFAAAYKNSKLPDLPDTDKIDKLLLEIYGSRQLP